MQPDKIVEELTAKMISEQAKRFMNEISAIERMHTRLRGNLTDGYTYNPICKKNTFINELKTRRNDMNIDYDYGHTVTYEKYNPVQPILDENRKLRGENQGLKNELNVANYRLNQFEKSCKNMRIKKVHFNAPYTIVIWEDKTKTMVKCGENDIYDPEKGLAMCIAKKLYGKNESKSNYYEVFKKWITDDVSRNAMLERVSYIRKISGRSVTAIVSTNSISELEFIDEGINDEPIRPCGIPGVVEHIFSTKEEAWRARVEIIRIISNRGYATLADWNEFIGLEPEKWDYKCGWTNTKGSIIRKCRDGWRLRMPAFSWEESDD